jgi:hypothetical protein
MSRVKVNEVTNKLGVGPVDFPDGITGVALTVTGNVTVGGTIISEDTTNVDSVGWVTARSGLNVGPPATGIGATIHANGDAVFAGVTTAPTFVGALTGNADTATLATNASGLSGTPNITVGFSTVTGFDSNALLREKCNVTAGKLSDNLTINLDNGMVHLFTTAESTTAVPNIMSTVGINTQMGTGDAITVTLVTTANASGYCTGIQVDGAAVTENWIGGSAPSDGGSSGVDIHAFTIMKTASETYTVIGNQSKTS